LDPLLEVEEAGVVVALLDDMHESNVLLFPGMAWGHVTKMPKDLWKRYNGEKCLQGQNRP